MNSKKHILMVTPVPPDSQKGNQVTAERWKYHLTNLGHTVKITQEYKGQTVDGLIALHARKSAAAIRTFDEQRNDEFLVVGLGGTDIYRDYPDSPETRDSIERADRLVILQPLAKDELPPDHQDKCRTIYQSVLNTPIQSCRPDPDSPDTFQVVSVAHIRPVKDPIRLPMAFRKISDSLPIRGFHLGSILDEDCGTKFQTIADSVDHFHYLGEQGREETLRTIKGADLLVISSRLEGGANVVSESIVFGTPVLASDIPGNRGMLGQDYPGYFPVEDEETLAKMILRTYQDDSFYETLKQQIKTRQPDLQPETEEQQWKSLLKEIETDPTQTIR